MPFEIRPIADAPQYEAAPKYDSRGWDWLASQPYSRDHAYQEIGNYRPGSLGGGPTQSQYGLFDDPKKYAILAPAPLITEKAQTQKAFGRFGTASLDLIDPFLTAQSIGQGIGMSADQATGVARGAQTFLGERDIDPFGQGSSGVPSRLADYATGWLSALYDQATGKPIKVPIPTGADALQYNFQRDPAYWALVSAPGADDQFLSGVAKQLAGRYVSGDNGYLVDKLFEQFKLDRDRATGVSSGDRRLDYQAKLAFTADYIAQRSPPTGEPISEQERALRAIYGAPTTRRSAAAIPAGLMQLYSGIVGALPFVGADIREMAYKHPQQIEVAWKQLTNEQRRPYFDAAGAQMLIGDATVWIPLLGGLGAVEAVAARAGGVAAKAFKAYEYTRNVTTAIMATGLTIATANWALEASVPGYAEGFGKRLDYARPISNSNLAGLFNQMGFFASGTFGGNLAVRALARGTGKVIHAVPAVPKLGLQELSFFKNVHGGGVIQRELAATGLPDAGILELAPKHSFMSRTLNYLRAQREAIYDAYTRGHPTGTKLDDIVEPQARVEAANAALLRGIDQGGNEAEGLVRAMLEARRPRPLLAGAAQRMHDAAVRLARFVDDEMARTHIEEYGDAWLMRRAGATSIADLERYARDTVTRLGGDGAKLAAHNGEGWGQVIRSLHDYEYNKQLGLLFAVSEGSDEAGRLLLMQADHLFANDVDRILAQLAGDDAALAAAAVANTIRTKREAAAWFAREWEPPAGVAKVPENVKPAELAAWMDEVKRALPSRRALPDPASTTAGEPLNAFHVELESKGLWTLGFKPVDEAGNAISYVRRSNGRTFTSPWIEYPMGHAEAIELGNRGILTSKADAITRGFRTWKIVEYQKGLLYRRLSSRLDVSAEQIESFHAGVMRLARDIGAQPQTLGAVGRATSPIWGKEFIQEKLNKLIGEIFGPGPHLVRSGKNKGKPIDFFDEIAKSYRQAFRLNLTAGLTSYLKANLGEVGSQIAWLSDIAYVQWRFNMSPVFKGGELAETTIFNAMRGVRDTGPDVMALYYRAGVGNDYGAFASELPFDPIVQGTAAKRATYVEADPSGRFAASEAFYARHLPEDFELRARTAFEQGAAADMRSVHMGGQLPSSGWMPRSTGRVVTDDAIPDTHTIALGDIRPDLLSADQLASEQGIWHATTALNKIYDEGIKARREIPAGGPEPVKGETWSAWRKRGGTVPESPMSGAPSVYLAVPKTSYDAALFENMPKSDGSVVGNLIASQAGPGVLRPQKGAFDKKFRMIRDPDGVHAGPGDVILEFDPHYANLNKDLTTSKPLDIGAVNRAWIWDEAAGDHVLHRMSFYVTGSSRQALGGGLGKNVSTTFNYEHAFTIAERLQFASRAARNEVTNAEILEHFASWYGDDWYTMAKVLGANPAVDSKGVLHLSSFGKGPKLAGGINDFDQLVTWMDTRGKYLTGRAKYQAVQDLDGALIRNPTAGEFSGAVILAGAPDDVAKINPDEVGVVRLAVRKGAVAKDGADAFELEFKSDDLLVVDDRARLDALADDEEGLLRQLRATLAEQPKEGQLSIADQMVGGNGFAPGMEDRARRILTRLEDIADRKLDGGPTWKWINASPEEQAAFAAKVGDDGWMSMDGKEFIRARLDHTTETKPIEQLFDEYQQRPGAANAMEDVAGTPEAMFDRLIPDLAPQRAASENGWRKDAWDTFSHPARWKLEQATKLQIKLAREEFPNLLALSGNEGVEQVLRSLPGDAFKGGVNRTDRWSDWLIEDRNLLAKWVDSQAPADWDALLAHAGTDANRAAFNELYASEEWASLSALMSANFRVAGQEAFGVHFFSVWRSPLERSINHPLLGLYPASWSLKAAREWTRFLFNNRTLGIDLGMAPAQAIAAIVHAQHASFAQMSGEDLDAWLGRNGPLGSPLFIFNLVMPGDWSGLPFALSRPVRDYARPLLATGTLPNGSDLLWRNITQIGLPRDGRLFIESIGQIGELLFGPTPATPRQTLSRWSVQDNLTPDYEPPR